MGEVKVWLTCLYTNAEVTLREEQIKKNGCCFSKDLQHVSCV